MAKPKSKQQMDRDLAILADLTIQNEQAKTCYVRTSRRLREKWAAEDKEIARRGRKLFWAGAIVLAGAVAAVSGIMTYETARRVEQERLRAKKVEVINTLEDGIRNDSFMLMEKSLKMSDYDSEIYCRIGDYYFRKNHNKAREYYQNAIEKDGLAYAHYSYGICSMIQAFGFNYEWTSSSFWTRPSDAIYSSVNDKWFRVVSYQWNEEWRERALRHLRIAYDNVKNFSLKAAISRNIGFLEKDKPEESEHTRVYLQVDYNYMSSYTQFNIAQMIIDYGKQ